MLERYLSKNLKEGETVLRIVRQYPIQFGLVLAASGIVLVADFFLLAFLLSQGKWGALAFIAVFLAGGLVAFRAWYIWAHNALIITDVRIIDLTQKGFFSRTVSEAHHRKVQDISYMVSGVAATALKYGTVAIQTAGSQAKIELDRIHHPEQLQELLTQLQEQCTQGETDRIGEGQ